MSETLYCIWPKCDEHCHASSHQCSRHFKTVPSVRKNLTGAQTHPGLSEELPGRKPGRRALEAEGKT